MLKENTLIVPVFATLCVAAPLLVIPFVGLSPTALALLFAGVGCDIVGWRSEWSTARLTALKEDEHGDPEAAIVTDDEEDIDHDNIAASQVFKLMYRGCLGSIAVVVVSAQAVLAVMLLAAAIPALPACAILATLGLLVAVIASVRVAERHGGTLGCF